ncbi:hypothetical protein TYRP_020051, partial [Tyrophagus putrescentiae]
MEKAITADQVWAFTWRMTTQRRVCSHIKYCSWASASSKNPLKSIIVCHNQVSVLLPMGNDSAIVFEKHLKKSCRILIVGRAAEE